MAIALPERAVAERTFELTTEQKAAVEWGDGPLMVLAGAGTGKTTVVVERVRHLLASDQTLEPENVLVLTYNVKAAAELMDRLEEALGLEIASRLWVHNFHSFGHRVLSDHRSDLGLTENADVLDQVGQRLLLRELRPAFMDFLYHPMARDPNAAGRFADVIGRAKDELVTPPEFAAFAQGKREAFDMTHDGGFDRIIDELRERDALGRLWQVNVVRRELVKSGREAADKIASRESRRDVSGTGEAVWWNQMTKEQERLAKGLMPTYIRDAEALDVQRLIEEARAYEVYQDALRERGLLDFGEQQLLAIELLTSRPNILRGYQDQFRHVLVDEFQDANMAQILLLEMIGRGPNKPDNVVVVGDDDQSIYRFRGASYAAFEEFTKRFQQAPVWDPEREVGAVQRLPLLENRRSTADILSAASRLIARNRRLKKGALIPTKEAGVPVQIVHAADEHDEADVVVNWIKEAFEALPAPRRWSDIAVLYRKHRHRELIVDRLRKHAITDALLGAVSAGDIGTFFPPTDRRWKGADSTVFLKTALEEIALAGYKIVNLDCVLIMHRPKIVPIASQLRERVADLLHLDLKRVSIKGKTPEGLTQDGTAVAHVVVLLQALELPEDPQKLVATAEAPTDADIDAALSTIAADPHDITALGRKRSPFDTDDLT